MAKCISTRQNAIARFRQNLTDSVERSLSTYDAKLIINVTQ
jgi:hypothetical protein